MQGRKHNFAISFDLNQHELRENSNKLNLERLWYYE